MYDLFLMLKSEFKFDYIKQFNLEPNSYAVMTLHRDFNVDSEGQLRVILANIAELAKHMAIVFPMHPRTKRRVSEFQLGDMLSDIHVTEPIDYLNLMGLVSQSKFIITDSGGLQKEAYYAGKPAILFMEDPAWHELVEAGVNTLVNGRAVKDLAAKLIGGGFPKYIYGHGEASKEIVRILKSQAQF
jgi:UDP-N-acetylglucosamine 2-epimerase (non-hydrolysing)